uniref:Uncharacterized protein n=1 Tax=Chenopodium quinoa TaxID=63459 RepID=A0A803L3I7_CHEQI
MDIETHGPYGLNRDPNWKLVLDDKESVKEVIIYVRNDSGLASGINFVVADHNGNLTNQRLGYTDITNTYPTTSNRIILHSGEYLTQGPKVEEKKENKVEENSEEKMEEKKTEKIQVIDTEEKRGSLAFFATYRPPVPLDIYSANYPPMSARDEELMTDGKSYNYNGQVIPPTALKTILQRPLLRDLGTDHDVDSGSLSGMIFVSERTQNLETLHIAILFRDKEPKVQVFNFAQVYDTFKGVRMEDSGCIAGNYLNRIQNVIMGIDYECWLVVKNGPNIILKTDVEGNQVPKKDSELVTADYKLLEKNAKAMSILQQAIGQADMSPSVSPDGKRIAVATFQIKAAGWDGEIEDLRTSICVMDIEEPLNREFVVIDGGWPTWGSNDVLYFHRNVDKVKIEKRWGVFRVHLHEGPTSVTRVTPEDINNKGGIKRIGYHRCHSDKVNTVNDKNVVVKVIDSGYSRIGGMFAGHVNHPCFSPDGRSLVLTADLAGVSCDPVSMPLFVHSVRPYGDIFIIDIDPDDIYKNSNVKRFTRVTHSRYENATATWTMVSSKDLHTKWKVNIAGTDVKMYSPKCPFVHQSEAESFHMTGHLLLQAKRCC